MGGYLIIETAVWLPAVAQVQLGFQKVGLAVETLIQGRHLRLRRGNPQNVSGKYSGATEEPQR